MSKTEPTTFREKLAMFLMRQAYIWIEKIDRKAVPKVCSIRFTFEHGRGMVVRNGASFGSSLCYITDYEYERAHTEALNKGPMIRDYVE